MLKVLLANTNKDGNEVFDASIELYWHMGSAQCFSELDLLTNCPCNIIQGASINSLEVLAGVLRRLILSFPLILPAYFSRPPQGRSPC